MKCARVAVPVWIPIGDDDPLIRHIRKEGTKGRLLFPRDELQSTRSTAMGLGGVKFFKRVQPPLHQAISLGAGLPHYGVGTSGPTTALSRYQGPVLSPCQAKAAGPSTG